MTLPDPSLQWAETPDDAPSASVRHFRLEYSIREVEGRPIHAVHNVARTEDDGWLMACITLRALPQSGTQFETGLLAWVPDLHGDEQQLTWRVLKSSEQPPKTYKGYFVESLYPSHVAVVMETDICVLGSADSQVVLPIGQSVSAAAAEVPGSESGRTIQRGSMQLDDGMLMLSAVVNVRLRDNAGHGGSSKERWHWTLPRGELVKREQVAPLGARAPTTTDRLEGLEAPAFIARDSFEPVRSDDGRWVIRAFQRGIPRFPTADTTKSHIRVWSQPSGRLQTWHLFDTDAPGPSASASAAYVLNEQDVMLLVQTCGGVRLLDIERRREIDAFKTGCSQHVWLPFVNMLCVYDPGGIEIRVLSVSTPEQP
jgi:hypothetical protein